VFLVRHSTEWDFDVWLLSVLMSPLKPWWHAYAAKSARNSGNCERRRRSRKTVTT
jgi:hypothetical protein